MLEVVVLASVWRGEKEMITEKDVPRSMADAEERERRKTMLFLPHMAPLSAYTANLRQRWSIEVPEFDPLDGGVNALVLFLFEKPGPMTSEHGKRVGSGFISRNNDDATAEATFSFMKEAGIPRGQTLIWNVIPWWNGTVKVTREELDNGVACVKDLIALLPNLRVVVMVGRKAGRVEPSLKKTGLALITSDHPSPKVRAIYPERWKAIPSEWAKVRSFIDRGLDRFS